MMWLSANWVWLVLGIGALFLMFRMHGIGGGGCCGGHHQSRGNTPNNGHHSDP